MDFISLGIGFGGIAIVPLGAVIKKSYNNEHRITTLEANYVNMDEKLEDLKKGQTAQSDKLDRLIERFL